MSLEPDDFATDQDAMQHVLGELARGMLGIITYLEGQAAKNGTDAPGDWIREHITEAERIIHGRRWWLP
ncbi:hypothetical protein [Streptomyces longisporus]|uniref:Uncharacterized protein n=1 Tax=Streptomyces longisporus TaxID=1948 RepID=A0ABP6ATK7_STRLO